MEILIRNLARYTDVKIYHQIVTIDLGLHNDVERRTLAIVFQDAADQLREGLDEGGQNDRF